MNAKRIVAVAQRIALGFRRDHRSLGLLIGAPLISLSLVGAIWGSNTQTTPNVAVASDRIAPLPAPIVARFVASAAIHGRTATYDEGLRMLRDHDVDALVWLDGATVRIVIEGSDPLQSGSIGGAVQQAFVAALGAAGAQGPSIVVDKLYGGPQFTLLDYLAPGLVAFFGFFFIFLLSAVSFLRERTSGTLERLMATPLRRGELVVGYLAGFSAFALIQALVIITFTVFVLQVHYSGNLATIFLVEAVLVVSAVSIGLLVSVAARNDLQAVQFVPIIIVPQGFLTGLLVPVSQLPDYLRPFSTILPLTYANEALKAVMIKGFELSDPLVLRDIGILLVFGTVMAIAAIASIRREVA